MSSILRYFLISGIIVLGMIMIVNDIPVVILIKEYIISLSALSLFGIILILYLLLRAIFLIILSPYRLVRRIFSNTVQIPANLLMANRDYLIGDLAQGKKLISNIDQTKLNCEILSTFYLLQALITEDVEKKIIYFKQLAEESTEEQKKFIACRTLARIYHNNGTYQTALDYSNKALNINGKDEQLIIIALDAASKLEKWQIVQSLLNNSDQLSATTKPNLIVYYTKLAKQKLLENNIEDSLRYLQLGLQYKPDDLNALTLYCTINFNLNLAENNRKVLENALILKPSLELFIMYHKAQPNGIDDHVIFENFIQLIKVDHTNIEALIAISAYYRLAYHLEQLTNQLKHAYNEPLSISVDCASG